MEFIAKVENVDGLLVVSSRVIAEQLGKEHSKVLRTLEELLESPDVASLIISSSYKVEGQTREYKQYLLTEKGFTLYVMNIQGYNDFKLAYINEFERMRNLLSNPINMLLSMSKEQLAQATLDLTQRVNNLQLANIAKDQVIAEYEPKIQYLDKILADNSSLLTVTQIAKDYDLSAKRLNEILHEEKVQYKQSEQWLLYSKHVGLGYTESVTYLDKETGKTYLRTKWKQKGRIFIHNILTSRGIMALEDR